MVGALGLVLRRSIARPLSEVSEGARTLSHGDLAFDVSYAGRDEIGDVAAAFRDLHVTAERLVGEIRATNAVPSGQPELGRELSRVADGIAEVLEELREMSRGIHPAILSLGGLGPALKALARRSPVPVELDVQVQGRLPERAEVAAYFVVSEALANVAKHARASVVRVRVEVRDGTLTTSISDDGVGGADPSRGSGLIGLTDRVEASGGTISISSHAGAGTQLTAELPLDPG